MMRDESNNRLLVIDGNEPWVRSLFEAMPVNQAVDFLCPHNVGVYLRKPRAQRPQIYRWRELAANIRRRDILLPGWTRFAGASTFLLHRAVRSHIARFGKPRALIFTLPFYADLAALLPDQNCVYYAFDPFLFYEWNRDRVMALETKMIAHTQAVCAISAKLAEDFSARGDRPVFHTPNGVTQAFITRMAEAGNAARPADLPAFSGITIGCTGQINNTYDWDLIEELTLRLPEVRFLFIGPIIENNEEIARNIEATLHRPNVLWLGPREHAKLPEYLASVDICFNPLRVNAHNDRRCPLRLFDYMATLKPVLTTNVAEAREHASHMLIGENAEACVKLIQRVSRGEYHVDRAARSAYILQHTWESRAQQFLKHLEALQSKNSRKTR